MTEPSSPKGSDLELREQIVALLDRFHDGQRERKADAILSLLAARKGQGEWRGSKAPDTSPNWALCPSTHCERGQECRAPSDCTIKRGGRRALLPAFHAHLEAEYGGKLPPVRWDERFGGLPYSTAEAQRFRDFMAGVDLMLSVLPPPSKQEE